jgi:hypothetical protein
MRVIAVFKRLAQSCAICLPLISAHAFASSSDLATIARAVGYDNGQFYTEGKQVPRAKVLIARTTDLGAYRSLAAIKGRGDYALPRIQAIDRFEKVMPVQWVLFQEVSREGTNGSKLVDEDTALANYYHRVGPFLIFELVFDHMRVVLTVSDPVSHEILFQAEHRNSRSSAFFSWSGISDNEFVNPVFNAYIDWEATNRKNVLSPAPPK